MTTPDQAIEQEIQAKGLTAPRITPADIEANIASEHYFTAAEGVLGAAANSDGKGTKGLAVVEFDFASAPALPLLTFCVLVLRNGTKVVGINYGAIDPAQHSAEMGRQEARKQAIEKVWELLGFRLRDRLAGD